jgi:hypothetical protein
MDKQRRDKGIPQLTERDRYVLTWIGDQYAVRLDTLQKLLGRMAGIGTVPQAIPGLLAIRNVYRIVARWENVGCAQYQKFWDDTPGWVWLTPTGLKARGLSYAPWSPRQGSDFEHLHIINELRFKLEERYSLLLPWMSDRRLRKEAGEEKTKDYTPDARIMVDDTRIAIQVEITPKSVKRTEAIIKNTLDRYEGVWYFVNDSTEPLIRRLSRTYSKIKVYKLSEVLPEVS